MSASRATLPLFNTIYTHIPQKPNSLLAYYYHHHASSLSAKELLNSCSFFWQTKHRVMRRRIECDLGRRHATPRQTNQAFSRAAEKVEVVTKPWEMIWNITLPLAANTEYYYSELPLTAAAGLLYTKYIRTTAPLDLPKVHFYTLL